MSDLTGVVPVVLAGALVRLEPLSMDHLPGLVSAASESRDTYLYTSVPASRAPMEAYVAAALAASDQLAFATVAGGVIVGSTRFCNMECWEWPPNHPLQRRGLPDAVEVGYTWLAASAQRTGVNTEAKLLMLSHAFDMWRVHRVSLRTDRRNERSRRAIERLGASFEGIGRAERPGVDGSVRDTALFSIVSSEWPGVRERLHALLDRRAALAASRGSDMLAPDTGAESAQTSG